MNFKIIKIMFDFFKNLIQIFEIELKSIQIRFKTKLKFSEKVITILQLLQFRFKIQKKLKMFKIKFKF